MPGIRTSASTQPGASSSRCARNSARRRKRPHREPARPQQPRGRGEKGRIVVDDVNGGFGRGHCAAASSAIGSVKRNAAPPLALVLCPEPPAVRLDDRAGDRQAHAHAVRLGGEERVEDPRERAGGDAGAGVAHGDLDGLRAVEPRGHADAPIVRARAVERVHAVENEVEQHLLQMHAVATDVRQIARHVHVQLHLPRRRIDPHERRDVAHERAHVEPPRVERLPLEQPAHAVDDVARALVVVADVGKNRADFVEVRRWVLQEELRRLRVAQDRRERLIDLVRQRRRELAHHRDAPRVGDLLPEALRLLLRRVCAR